MNIHSYEKLWLIAAMVLIVGFIATITYGSVALGITMVGDQQETVEPLDLDEDERFTDPRVEHVGEDEYEVYVVARTFDFQPDPIEVPEGSQVTFHVTSQDVIHSFSVPGTNINTMVIPGEVAEMTVEFDEPEEYGIVCNEYCGSQHHEMEGQLEVVPEDEFDMTELSVDAPSEVETGEEIEITASVENGMLDDLETSVDFEMANETVTESEDVTVAGGETTETTFTVDSEELGEGEHDWTVSVDDYESSGSVEVLDELETDDENDGGDDDE